MRIRFGIRPAGIDTAASLRGRRLIACFALIASFATPVCAAEPVRDEILMLGFETFSTAQLPAGAGSESVYPFGGYTEMVVLPSGRVLVAVPLGQPRRQIALKELLPDGSLRDLATLAAPPSPYYEDRLHDMAVDSRGRLYVLTQTWLSASPPATTRLVEVDPVSGATLGSTEVRENIYTIATAPEGFYGYDDTLLYPLDPDTGLTGPPLLYLPIGVHVSEIEADSGGKLWLLANPVCETGGTGACIYSLDLENGGAMQKAPEAMYANVEFLYEIAIRRRCVETSTVRCLQDGRFRAEIAFSDYAGVAGVARSAAARSSDTGVFSFFQEDNWELMVKVLDGCGINSSFWVYGAASTDVAYTLTVTDTETGAQKVYRNALGNVAVTITDNQAFSCSPADLAAARARAPEPAVGPSVKPVAATAAAPVAGTALRHDELLAYQPPQGLRRASLPAGPTSPASPVPAVYALQAMPDGRVLAVSDGGGGTVMLSELREDGSLANIGRIGVGIQPLAMGPIDDMAVDHRGSLWLLGPPSEASPDHLRTLVLIDSTNGYWAYGRNVPSEITAIAGGPRGLWAAAGHELYELSPTPFYWVDAPRIPLPSWQDIDSLDVDSVGRVYFAGHRPACTPNCTPIGVYDPRTGEVTAAPAGLPEGPVAELTIRRRCADSPTSRCLQEGRFRAEIAYEGYDGAAGAAQAAPARSADTGIFSFFEPANWEQMVKVLDGCSFNSHYWVYAAASTDVAFELRVTDTQTGAQKVYANPLGQIALTVTDSQAFACAP